MTLELFGREAELAALERWLAGPLPAVLVVDGEAGIGKTSLLQHAFERAGAQGWRVVLARPVEAESQLAFAGFDDLLRGAAGKLQELPEPQRHALAVALLLEPAGPDPPDTRAIGVATSALFRLMTKDAPLLVVIDDVQWLDAATADVLQFVFRRLGDLRLAVVLSRRTGPTDDVDSWPFEPDPALPPAQRTHLRLGPLSLGALHALLQHRIGMRLTRPQLLRIHELSAGNPFYALELARAFRRRNDDPAVAEVPLPSTLRRLVEERLGSLSQRSLEVLLAVALDPAPTRTLLAQALADVDVDAALAAAVEAGVVELDGELVSFTHPLLRSTVAATADHERQRALHRRLAAAAPSGEARARHLALGMDRPDENAAVAVEAGARAAAARGAPAIAAELAERAAALTPTPSSPDLVRRHVLAGESAFAAGDYERGRRHLEAAAAMTGSGVERGQILLQIARLPRDVPDVVALAQAARACAEGEPSVAAEALVLLSQAAALTMNPEGALEQAREAVAAAENGCDSVLIARTRAQLCWAKAISGRGIDLVELQAAAALEKHSAPRPVLDGAQYTYALMLERADELDAARAELEEIECRARALGDSDVLIETLDVLVYVETSAGRYADATAACDEALELAVQNGHEFFELTVSQGRGELEILLGRLENATRIADAMAAHADRTGLGRMRTRAEALLGSAAMMAGEWSVAAERYKSVHRDAVGSGLADPGLLAYQPNAVEVFLAVEDHQLAEEVVAELESLASRLGRTRIRAYAHRCRGLLDAASGRFEQALAELEHAVALNDELPLPLERARNLLALGRVQRRANRRREARVSLEQALAIFDDIGAPLWAERARDELRSVGGRTRTDEGLTPAEDRVALLVSRGLTNKEVAAELVVSVRAVEANLSRVYAKLGVRSRAELAARYREHRAPP